MSKSTSACWASVGEAWKFWSSGKSSYVICAEDLAIVAFSVSQFARFSMLRARAENMHRVSLSQTELPKGLHTRRSIDGPSRQPGYPVGSIPRLREQCDDLSRVSGILQNVEASFGRNLGEERSLLHSSWRGGFPARQPERSRPISDTGHFALETHVNVIASAMTEFLAQALV
jgi:hypothetical protein